MKKKILFAAQNLNIGGVQAAFVNLLQKMSKDGGYEITVFTFAGGTLEKEIPKGISVFFGGKILKLSATPFETVKKSGNIFDIILRILITLFAKAVGTEKFYRCCFKKQKEKYDIAVSYFTDIPAGVFNKGTNLFVSDFTNAEQKVAFIHTDPVLGGFDTDYCRKIYRPFDKIICVSDAVREKFNDMLPEYSYKTETRHNEVDAEKIKELALKFSPFEKSDFDIVTVARVDDASKRISGIVNICCRLKEKGIANFKWRIIGDGPDFLKNKKLSEKLNVEDVLFFEGEKTNPYPYIHKSDLFALYSAYEGFPLVIEEAKVLGTPILSKNYAAAKEQISKNCGEIAYSDEEFFEKLCGIIGAH